MQNQQADTLDSPTSTTTDQPKTLGLTLTSDFIRRTPFTCPSHGLTEATSIRFSSGDWSKPQCEQCKAIAAEARRIDSERRDAEEARKSRESQVNYKLEAARIPLRFQSQVFETYMPADDEQLKALTACRAYAEGFAETLSSGRCLILHGRLGTGKTHLACGIIQHIVRTQLRSALYVSFSKAVRSVKETYSNASDRTEQQAIDALAKPHLLVIDEVGVQFGSEAEKLIGFEILNARYEVMKPTVIVSNLDMKALTETLGERVIDRLRENGGKLLTFTGRSHRGAPTISV